jgi:hypothetical protein
MLTSPGRGAARLLGLSAAAAGLLLTGCSSSSGGTSVTALPTPTICTQIGGVLGNGPDPDADPVGYAEAQIRPLAEIHSSQPGLQDALDALDIAFRHEFDEKASAPSKAEVRAAQHRVDSLCPGAAS